MRHLEDESINKLTNSEPYTATLIVNVMEVQLEVDIGSPWTIIPEEVFRKLSQDPRLDPCTFKLKSYRREG